MMKVAIVLVLLVAAACAAPEKRFIKDTFVNLGHSISDAFQHTFNAAKNTFHDLTSHLPHIDFDSVVDLLIPYIDSGMTESACKSACVGAAAAVLGPAAALAGSVCSPVCSAALAKLEDVAGK